MPRSAGILAVGAVTYLVLMGPLSVTFDATPLIVGLVVLAAGTIGRAPALTATGLTLVGWGLAVLLTRHGPLLDEREAATFLVGADSVCSRPASSPGRVPAEKSERARRSSSSAERPSSSLSTQPGSMTGRFGRPFSWPGRYGRPPDIVLGGFGGQPAGAERASPHRFRWLAFGTERSAPCAYSLPAAGAVPPLTIGTASAAAQGVRTETSCRGRHRPRPPTRGVFIAQRNRSAPS